jgi:hypothetical protein
MLYSGTTTVRTARKRQSKDRTVRIGHPGQDGQGRMDRKGQTKRTAGQE